MEGYSAVQKVPQIASSKKSSETSLFLTLQLVKCCSGGPPIPRPNPPGAGWVQFSGFFWGKPSSRPPRLPAFLQDQLLWMPATCELTPAPWDFTEVQVVPEHTEVVANCPGAGECSLLSVALQVLCPGDLAVAESCGHLVRWPRSGCPSRRAPPGRWSLTQLGIFFFHFSFSWGWDSPPGKRIGKPGNPSWFAPRTLIAHTGCRLAPSSQNSMEVQNGRRWWWWWWINNGRFPESLRPGPLPALALLRHPSPHQLRAKAPRPLDQNLSTQWHYMQSVFPSVQPFFSGVLLYIFPLQSRAACRSSCESHQHTAPCSLCCISLRAAGTLPGQAKGEQRTRLSAPAQLQSWTKTGSCCSEGWVPHLPEELREVRKGTSASLLSTFPFQTSAGPGEWMRTLDSLSLFPFSKLTSSLMMYVSSKGKKCSGMAIGPGLY